MITLWATAFAVTFGDAELPAGTTAELVHDTTLSLTLDVKLLGQHTERRLERKHHQAATWSQTESGHKLVWKANRHQALEPGHEHDRVLPVVGPTYIVDKTTRRADGVEPSSEELSIVSQMQLTEQLVGIRAMLANELEVGDQRPAGAMFAGILAQAPGTPELVGGGLTLQRVESNLATFALTLSLRSQETDAKGTAIVTTAEGTGTLVVDTPSGRTVSLELSGTVDVNATRWDLTTTGHGTFSTRTTLVYR